MQQAEYIGLYSLIGENLLSPSGPLIEITKTRRRFIRFVDRTIEMQEIDLGRSVSCGGSFSLYDPLVTKPSDDINLLGTLHRGVDLFTLGVNQNAEICNLKTLENDGLVRRIPFFDSFDGPLGLLRSQVSTASHDDELSLVQAYEDQVKRVKNIAEDRGFCNQIVFQITEKGAEEVFRIL